MKTWMKQGIIILEAMKCRVFVFKDDIGEVPISHYATPDSFTTKQARQDLWMGNMMWQMKEHCNVKLTGEQARRIMHKYMSSDFYADVLAHWKKVKSRKPKEKPKPKKDTSWIKKVAPPPPEDKTVRRPVRKPVRKAIRKPIRKAMK